MIRCTATAALLLVISPAIAAADVRLPAVIASGMVVQRDQPIVIWGDASPGEVVTVTFADHAATAHADAGGDWSLQLPAMAAGGPHALTVAAGNTLTLTDVLVGDVWLCAGQSNMQRSLSRSEAGQHAIATADRPNLRLLTVDRTTAATPTADVKLTQSWARCTPETVAGFSAVGYHFGAAIQDDLGVPIGLINSSWGGTRAEAWTSEPALRGQSALDSVFARTEKLRSADLESQRRHLPSHLFNSMIAPLTRMPIAGVIWYQGESNAPWPDEYAALLPTLITDWRTQWDRPALPFGIVQLTAYRREQAQPVEASTWAAVRDVQRRVSEDLPNVGLAIITDLGDAEDIHPANKRGVGQRLALWALAEVYGKPYVAGGPMLSDVSVTGDRVTLTFDQVGDGLVVRGGGELEGFAVAGADRRFVWADAAIDGSRVIVQAPAVGQPVAVRYGWADNPIGNLFNVHGLPASPFRTDDGPTSEATR